MMSNEGISVADALALRNSGSNDNDGFGGGNGAWWVIILILFFAIGGWGRGFGNNGNDGGNSGSNCLDTATLVAALGGNRGYGYSGGINEAFNFNQLDNGIRGLERGLCDGFYSMNNSINSVASALQQCCCETQQNMLQGFNGVDRSICNLGYNMGQGFNGIDKSIMQSNFNVQAGFNGLTNQLASCCCDLERGQENIKYAVSQATNDILVANDKNTDRIINFLTQTEMQNLRTQVDEYRTQLQQATQTQNIVNQLMPVAKPAYITCSPYASAFGYPFSNGCGCNTGGCCA